MSVVLNSRVIIGNYIFRDNIKSAVIKSSWKSLCDTAVVCLPNLKRLSDGQRAEDLIKVGDKVLIQLGYDGLLYDEFYGWVSSVKPSIPLEIMCEDQMWQLKRTTLSKSWRTVKLREVIEFIAPEAVIDCPDITLSPFRLDNVSPAKALQKLKEDYLLCAYFRKDKLYVGLPYFEKMPTVHYHFQKNAVMDSLEYRRGDDVKVKIKAIGIQPNNTRQEIEVGDSGGDTVTMNFYNMRGAELKVMAEQKLKEIKYDGYEGRFMSFGVPRILHGMPASIMDDRYPYRATTVFVDSIETHFAEEGFHRFIEPGRRAS